jgi:hypothetical protein
MKTLTTKCCNCQYNWNWKCTKQGECNGKQEYVIKNVIGTPTFSHIKKVKGN